MSASYEGLCRVWDVETGACLKTIHDTDAPPIGHVRFTPNSKFLLTATLDSTLRLWEVAAGRCLKKYKGARPGRCRCRWCLERRLGVRPAWGC